MCFALAFFLVSLLQILTKAFAFSQVITMLAGTFSQPGLLSFYLMGGAYINGFSFKPQTHPCGLHKQNYNYQILLLKEA